MVTEKKSNRKANGLGCLAGGLVFCLLFPLCFFFFGWLSFALGMSCAFPSQCSTEGEIINPINDFVFWGRIGITYIPQLCRGKSRQIWVKSPKK